MTGKLLKEVEGEVARLLSDLIRINTSNPPGNEMESAKYLAETLGEEGFDCEIFESAPGRGNLVTRMKGTGKRPSLLLLSHLDVVPAKHEEWTVDPFGGVIKDGFVWGRGALDMKGMTTIEVMTMKLLKRKKVKLKGDVILAATADEEKGGNFGVGYLLQEHPEKMKASYVLNEGGGGGVAIATPTRNMRLADSTVLPRLCRSAAAWTDSANRTAVSAPSNTTMAPSPVEVIGTWPMRWPAAARACSTRPWIC